LTGMKPKILCTQCGSALTPSDLTCPSCGVAVEWTHGMLSTSSTILPLELKKKGVREKTKQQTNGSAPWSSKSILGVAVVIACAVIAYEVITERISGPEPASQPLSSLGDNSQMQLELKELEGRLAANPEDMALTLQLANLLHDAAIYERAISYYKAYLEKNPKDANALVDLGICYKEIGDFIEAKKKMKEALKVVPKHLNAHFNLGIVCLSEGSIQESNEWFTKTVALDPVSEVGKRAQQLLTQHNSQSPKTK
jgi:tetratricopeptide (TPR) repeat protein